MNPSITAFAIEAMKVHLAAHLAPRPEWESRIQYMKGARPPIRPHSEICAGIAAASYAMAFAMHSESLRKMDSVSEKGGK